MDMYQELKKLSLKAQSLIDHIATEEATKTALVLPFINTLGYNVFDPLEVVPEFIADVGVKKGEKVDYAIKKDGKIIVLIECKSVGCELKLENASQLYRYFSVTESRFAVLTNGIVYKFYSDIDDRNKMDSRPFFEFNLFDFDEQSAEKLNEFAKSSFDIDSILSTASNLKYVGLVKKILNEQAANPDEDFIRFFVNRVYEGRFTQAVREQFEKIVKEAFSQTIRDRVNSRLKNALDSHQDEMQQAIANDITEPLIFETEDETHGYNIVRAIVHEVVDLERVHKRDTQSYFGVLLDDNNRKPICRLHFNTSQKYLGLFKNKVEERVSIQSLSDIYKYADRLKETIKEYEAKKAA